MEEDKVRISPISKYLLLGTAIFFDLLGLVPALQYVTNIVAYLTLGFWLRLKGISFGEMIGAKRSGKKVVMSLAKRLTVLGLEAFIPFIPGIWYFVHLVIKEANSGSGEHTNIKVEESTTNKNTPSSPRVTRGAPDRPVRPRARVAQNSVREIRKRV